MSYPSPTPSSFSPHPATALNRSSPMTTQPSPNGGGQFLRAVLHRRKVLWEASSAHKWALGNLLAAALVLCETQFHSLATLAGIPKASPVLALVLYGLLCLFLTNVVLDLWHHFFPFLGKDDLLLNSDQMQLLGIGLNDPGFKLSPQKSLPAHPNPFSPPKEGSFLLSSHGSPSSFNATSASAWSLSPNTPGTSRLDSSSPGNVTSLSSTSWIFQDQNVTPNQRRSTFHSSFDAINNEKSLEGYLQEFENWERHNTSANSDTSPGANSTLPSFWKPSSSQQSGNVSHIQDYSAALSKISYQLSTVMPGTPEAGGENKTLNSSSQGKSESICYKVGIDPHQLVSWMENLRMWISQTILVRLVDEIKDTNEQLADLGMTDALIGEAGLEKVRKCSQMPVVLHHIPTLHKLIPFLEVTIHQDYLVDRVRILATGGAISEFKWNGGGRFKGAEWTDKLPTDSEVVMHCVACYLDSRLPPVKGVVDGRVFSTLYYFRMPDRPKPNDLRVACAIVQAASKPPHYHLQIGEDKMELNAGRNNMLHTLLLFLHVIKTKEHGILGRVNLGRSGINVLWVIE